MTSVYAQRALLEVDEEDEKEDPEEAHGVPVPRSAVDGDLTQLYAFEAEHGDEREDEGGDADEQVDAVGSGCLLYTSRCV